MKQVRFIFCLLFFIIIAFGCSVKTERMHPQKVRGLADTVGFAHLGFQMDSIAERIKRLYPEKVSGQPEDGWKTAICPHDDYTYAGWLYSALLKNIKAKTVIIFGVAHKAKNFNLDNRLVFDSFDFWHGAYGNVRVSGLREQIIKSLPADLYEVNDSMQIVEHSVEALVPFLQKQNPKTEIVSILVPYMRLNRMDSIGSQLSKVLYSIMAEEKLRWGEDLVLLISSDAVHYGDEDWGGKNYATFGTDSLGYQKAVALEKEIINTCFAGELSFGNAARFFNYTVSSDDYKEYKWTWCGRYSIPFGLLTSVHLQEIFQEKPLIGYPVGYGTSIDHPELPVNDLGMGKTAIANLHHWVGYPAIGFR
jgi:MEMO1 family protein